MTNDFRVRRADNFDFTIYSDGDLTLDDEIDVTKDTLDGHYISTKTFDNLPCAHRRWAHEGHCAWVHGYSRSFTFKFACTKRVPDVGFVMDFGGLKEIKHWLEDLFDHTLLIDESDPLLEDFKSLEEKGACKLTILPDVGMEGTSKYVFDYVSAWLRENTENRVRLLSVECRENNKNSALYLSEPR